MEHTWVNRSILKVWKLQVMSLWNRHVTSQTCSFVFCRRSVAILPQLSNTWIHALCHCVPKWILFISWLLIPDMSVYIRHSCHDETWFQLFAQQALGHITFVYKFDYHRFSFVFNIYIVFISKSFSPDIKYVKGYSPWSTEMAFSRVPTSPKHEEYY